MTFKISQEYPINTLMKKTNLRIFTRCLMGSSKGAAIIFAMGISLVGTLLVGGVAQYFSSFSQTAFKNNDIGALRAALSSSMDYTLNGIRNRWCFSGTWSQNPTCKLTNPNNVERMVLSDEALRAIQASMTPADYGSDISKVRIKSITGSVKWQDITPEHPLHYVVKGLKDIGEDFVFNFKIIRVDNGVQKGREVVMQVEVELVLGSNSNILTKTRDSKITAISSIMVFPREINTNALVIANNLFLDRKDPGIGSAENGDVYISPGFDPDVPGIHFESPVFVNGNIYIPKADAPGYTPVTFGDKVIIGGGAVLEGKDSSAGFSKPLTSGGTEDRFYSQTQNFGGFLRGILLDPGADEGLSILGQVKKGSTPKTSADLCILRNSAKADLAFTRDSQLFMKVGSVNEAVAAETTDVTSSYKFVANLGSIDTFYKQGVSGSNQFKSSSPAGLDFSLNYNGADINEQRPTMRVTVALNGYTGNTGSFVAADMSNNATLNISMNPSDPSAIMRVTTTPYMFGTNPQSNAMNIQVDLINQEKFAMGPYGVKMVGSTLTTSPEPSIDVNFESFDVAYTTSPSGIKSGRTKGGPSNPIKEEDCPVGSTEYNSPENTKTINGTVYHCFNQFAWHPAMGGYKSNGFSFKRAAGGTEKRFTLLRNPAAPGIAGGYFTCPTLDTACPAPWDSNIISYPQEIDFVAFDNSCFSPPKGTDVFPSFGAADWGTTSFTSQARHSWGFTESGDNSGVQGFNIGTLKLNGTSSRSDGATNPVFIIASIYKTCVIEDTANFVAGFLVCDELIINSRSEPLRIIGTIIVGKMSVAQTALDAGIRWSNIFYPSAVTELRKAGILNASSTGENCDVPADPMWNPYPSIKRVQFLYKCNPITLRNKADPFQWTTVDPDCGLVDNKQMCKYRVMRYDIVELKRQEIL